MAGWHTRPMLAFDLETTGVDVETDRVVTAAVVGIRPGQGVNSARWLADPGVEIPEQATAVHGVTTDHARQYGEPPAEVLDAVTGNLAAALSNGVPVVGMNLAYDLTLLDRECRRHGVPTLDNRLEHDIAPIVDVRVLDKHLDPYRKGSRRLDALCEHYEVRLDGAHDSCADALGAARVAYRICQRHPDIAEMRLIDLHAAQIQWAREQAESLAAYFRRKGRADDADGVDGSWPVRPYQLQEVAPA